MSLPLPSLPGLTNVRVPLSSNVRELAARIRELDDSVKEVEVENAAGQRVAASTPLSVAAVGSIDVLVGGIRIKLLNPEPEDAAPAVVMSDPAAYAQLRAAVLACGTTKMGKEEWEDFCKQACVRAPKASASPDSMVALEWRDALAADGLLAVLDRGESVLLLPSAAGVQRDIVGMFLHEDEATRTKLAALRAELSEMEAEDADLSALEARVARRVASSALFKKGAVLTFLTAQFSGLAYLVYEVYSWDVMEPASYFLMLSYGVGGSVYFALKRRDASYDNLLRAALEKQLKRAGGQAGYDAGGHAALRERIERHRRACDMMAARLGSS